MTPDKEPSRNNHSDPEPSMPSYDPELAPPPKSLWESADPVDPANPAKTPDGVTPPPKHPRASWKTGPDKKPGRKKKILLALAVILLLLVLMAPTLVTTGPALSFVIGKFVNPQLNGQVQVSEASAGWFSGLSFSGLKILDDNNQVVIECKQLQTDLSVIDLLRGNLGLGQATASDAHVTLRRLPDGSLNIEHLVKPSNAPPSTDQRLPAITGVLSIENSGLIIQTPDGTPASYIDLSGTANIPDINNTIVIDFKLPTRAPGSEAGLIQLSGNLDLFANRLFNLENPKANLHLELSKVDAAILAPLLPPGSISDLAGKFNGSYTLNVPSEGPITITNEKPLVGQDVSARIAAAGPNLILCPQLELVLPTIYITRPKMLDDWQSYRFKTADNQSITLTSSLGGATVSADLSVRSLLALADNKAPGDTGNLSVKLSSGFKELQFLLAVADNLSAPAAGTAVKTSPDGKHSVLRDNLTLTRGSVTYDLLAILSPTQTSIQTNLHAKDITARNQQTHADIVLSPITLDANATLLGGGGAVPNLVGLKINLTSAFANMDMQGDSLDSLGGKFNSDLSKLQTELAQVFDFGGISLTGQIEYILSSSGAIASADGQANMKLVSTATNVKVSGIKGLQPINTPYAQFVVSAILHRGQVDFISSITDGVITLKTGSPQTPSLDFSATAAAKLSPDFSATINITQCKANLAVLARDYAPLFGFLTDAKASLSNGALELTSRLTLANNTVTIDFLKAQVNQLNIVRLNQSSQVVTVMPESNFTIDLAGALTRNEAGISGNFTQLAFRGAGGRIDISMPDREIFSFALDNDGRPLACSGQLNAILAGEYLAMIRDNMLPDMGASNPRILKATITSLIHASSEQGQPITLMATTDVKDLKIQTPDGQTLPTQSATVQVNGSLPRNGQSFTAEINVQSGLVNLKLSDIDVKLADATGKALLLIEMINSGKFTLDIPDLKTLSTYAQGLIPGLKLSLPVSDGQTSELVTLTSGKVDLTGEISRANNALVIKVPSLKTSAIGFTRGTTPQQLDSISKFNMEASIQPDSAGNIDAMTVSAFDLDAGAVQVSANQPFKITGLEAGGQLSAEGSIRITGDLAKVNSLATTLTGEPLGDQLAGQFILNSQITTRGDVITPSGVLTISDFSAGSGPQRVSEKTINLTVEMVINTALKSLQIRKVEGATASCQASVRGNVTDYDTDRNCDFTGTITYDAEKLLSLLRAILPAAQQAQLQDAVASGKYTRNFSLTGSYPAGLPFDQAIAKLKGELAFTLDTFNAPVLGTDVSLMDLKVMLANGVISIVPPVAGGSPVTARINNGELTLAGISMKLTANGLRINSPDNLQVLRQVSINPAFANNVLGKFVNPAFSNPQTSRGLMDLKIAYCRNLNISQFAEAGSSQAVNTHDQAIKDFEQWQKDQAAGKTSTTPAAVAAAPDPYGEALITFNVSEVQLGNESLNSLIGLMASGSITQQTLRGDITDAQIKVSGGKVTHDIPLMIDQKYAFRFAGGLDLQNLTMINTHIDVPTALLAAVRKATPQVQQYMPANITVPITGNISSGVIKPDIGKTVTDLLVQASQKALLNGVIDRATPKNPSTPDNNSASPNQQNPQGQANPQGQQPGNGAQAQPAEPAQPDPVGGILNLLEQQRQKDKEKKRQKELEKQQQQNR